MKRRLLQHQFHTYFSLISLYSIRRSTFQAQIKDKTTHSSDRQHLKRNHYHRREKSKNLNDNFTGEMKNRYYDTLNHMKIKKIMNIRRNFCYYNIHIFSSCILKCSFTLVVFSFHYKNKNKKPTNQLEYMECGLDDGKREY